MIAVIFESEPNPGKADDYFTLARALKPEMEKADGFIGIERFKSLTSENKFVSVSLWRDEAAVAAWRENPRHRAAQAKGKSEIFAHYRIIGSELTI